MSRTPINPDAIRPGDIITGPSGLGGTFEIKVEGFRQPAPTEPRRVYGRIVNRGSEWNGTEWSFSEIDITAHKPARRAA